MVMPDIYGELCEILTRRRIHGTMQCSMKNSNMFLVGSVVLILLAIALVAILDKTSPSNNANDVRARAATVQALTLTATVATVNQPQGTLNVVSVAFADKTSVDAGQNYWVVTTPAGFDFTTVSPGATVAIGVDPQTFKVSTHAMTALTLVAVK